MKKQISLFLIMIFVLLTISCSDSKTFVDNNGREFTAEPYGWADMHNELKKRDDVKYRICVGNVVWSVLLIETLVAPVVLTGWYLFEPIEYIGEE